MNKVKIIVYESNFRFINFLIDNIIYYSDLECNKDEFTLIVSEEDYKRIKRRFNTKVIKHYGKKGLVFFINYHKYMIMSFVFSLFILFLLSNTIFEVKVNTEDKNIKNIILSSLKEEKIYKYKRKKSFEELNIIKKRILDKNKDLLEWIEIIECGVTYTVEVTPRITIQNEKNKLKESSIYAKKDGLIKKIVVYKGRRIGEINDYVKRGEVLISGNILKDNNVVSKVNSEGLVYAEVWYKAKVSVPFKIVKKEYSGKTNNHYYLDINGFKFTIMGYDTSKEKKERTLLLSKPYLIFDIYKESKKIYNYKTYNLSSEEALNMAIKESENKIKNLLKKDEYIISKKVLKKEVKRSKMYVEVFFSVYENIGVTSNIDNLGEENASSN